MTAPTARIVAKREIAAGQRIEAQDFAVEIRQEFPSAPAAVSADEVTGRISRAAIPAGAVIRPERLYRLPDVQRGDLVEVEVQNGTAHLKFEARAEGSGSAGDCISLRNPVSGKRFVARVQAKGRVFVDGSAVKENP